MHPPEVREEIRRLVALGVNDCEISRRIGVPRTTVRDIRRPTYRRRSSTSREVCWRCSGTTKPIRFTDELYAYLLGLYLGDGNISPGARTARLRLALDAKYPGIIEEARAAMASVFRESPVAVHFENTRRSKGVVGVYGNHLHCLFPQHGRGKKHDRPIVLEPWQQEIVDRAPWPLIRGLIQSDGCRFDNRTGRYKYPSYDFSQVSDDIKRIFVDACRRVGVACRAYSHRVRIYDRASVSLMDAHVGAKF